MKNVIIQYLIIAVIGLPLRLPADELDDISLSSTSQMDVKHFNVEQKLEAYQKGKISLDELTGSKAMVPAIVAYYWLHTNEVSLRMKLPISRCLANMNNYQEAAKLSAEYVQVYSNDWHGWNILGGANMFMTNFESATTALANAARLGDEACYPALILSAEKADRLDVIQSMIPQMLRVKDVKLASGGSLDLVTMLAGYSLRVNQQDLFVKVLHGVSAKQISSRDDLLCVVTAGCERYKGKDIDDIRRRLGGGAGNASSSTATDVPSP